jgi:hypothetical protein
MPLHFSLKKFFLYLFASVGLVLCIISLVSLLNLGLRTYVFTKTDFSCREMYPSVVDGKSEDQDAIRARESACEENRTAEKQRTAAQAISMLVVGAPLYLYNWTIVRRSKDE